MGRGIDRSGSDNRLEGISPSQTSWGRGDAFNPRSLSRPWIRVVGETVVISALTAYYDARNYVDNNVNNLIKVYIKCDIETCKLRDPKGLYHAARKGEIDTLVGFNSEYLPPKHPDLTINTDFTSVITCVEQLLTFSKHIHE